MMHRFAIETETEPAESALLAADGSGEAGAAPCSGTNRTDEAGAGQETIRVQVSLLDSLMTLAGELVLSRNQLLQTVTVNGLKCAESVGQRIDLITSELQEAIMLTRMQPIGTVFDTFPRLVGDIATATGKDIELNMFGREVELDKTIIEAIGAPLMCLIGGAAEHGIEPPGRRRDAGKPVRGTIAVRAFHEAGQVVIEIEDDGAGLDGERLGDLAASGGLLGSEQVQALSEREKLNLAFASGLDGADGEPRTAGLDRVKAALDRLGGQIDVDGGFGGSTVFSIKLPLTLAIIPCQVIVTEGERYAIPQVNLEELLRIPAGQVKERIETVGSAEVVRLRGKLLPLVRLADVLGIERTYKDPGDGRFKADRRRRIADRRQAEDSAGLPQADLDHDDIPVRRESPDRRTASDSALNIVVVSTGPVTYGLIVDQLLDSEEIVIKPLGRHLQHCQGYAGATIMGDGRIALILDVANLAAMAQLSTVEDGERENNLSRETAQTTGADSEQRSMLVFHSAEQEQFAIRLDRVERIEKIRRSDIEYLGPKRVMQYRGGSLQLISIDEFAAVQPLAEREDLLVIVFSFDSRSIGLLACGPIDTRHSAGRLDDSTLRQPGFAASTIIGGQTTLLIDIDEMVGQLDPEWQQQTGEK